MKTYAPHKNLSTNVHRRIIHNSPKVETTQTSTKWWMDEHKVVYYTIQYYSAMTRNEALTRGTAWMNPAHTVLNGRSKSPNAIKCVIVLIWYAQYRQINTKSISSCHGQEGGGNGERLPNGYTFLFGETKVSWNQWWWVHNIVNIPKATEWYTL